MFGEKERSLKILSGEPMTLLEKDAQFEGKLTFEDRVKINGKFRGEVFSEGTLIIGEGAEVDANLEIDTIIIQGRVHGSIRAKSRIEMHPPAQVQGDIASPNLVISEGAFFEGTCSMGREPEAQVYEIPKRGPEAVAAQDEFVETSESLEILEEEEDVPQQREFSDII